MNSPYTQLANIIQQHRKAAGLTQQELAMLAGVGKTAVFDIEHAKPTVQFSTLYQILSALNITLLCKSPFLADMRELTSDEKS